MNKPVSLVALAVVTALMGCGTLRHDTATCLSCKHGAVCSPMGIATNLPEGRFPDIPLNGRLNCVCVEESK